MSVAATPMTMDQRPLSNYDKMSKSKQYEQSLHNSSAANIAGGGASGIGIGGGGGSGSIGAPPSGPASPTNSEEPLSLLLPPPQQQHHMPHHHHPHHHHHHHPQHQQQQTIVAEAVAAAEQRQRLLEDEVESLKLEQTRLSQQCTDAQRREKILMRRLANKEQEFQDYVTQIAEYKAAQAPSALALRSALLDPAVNLLFEKLKKELKATKAKLEETQNELSAWKFTPDSNTGKRLMAKCRLLYQENEELGKMTSNGRLAKLETELAMQKSFSEEVKKSQSELDDFLQELDEDVEGMQSTILFLQQELKTTRDRIQVLERENCQLKSGGGVAGVIIPITSSNSNSNDAIKDIEDENTTNIGLNGTMPPYNNISNAQPTVAPTTMIDMKFQSKISLETINENACLRTSSHLVASSPTTGVANDFYGSNGGNDEKIINNSTIITASKLRTVASRKRNFDCTDIDEAQTVAPATTISTPTTPALIPVIPITTAPPPPHVLSPRTLPPKKSKLRRSSVQSVEINDYENTTIAPIAASNVGVGVLPNILHNVAVAAAAAASETLNIVDNAVAGMANEETTSTGLLVDDAVAVAPVETVNVGGGGGVAQRIMTRRRSLRTQQNGNNLGGGGGSDSNH